MPSTPFFISDTSPLFAYSPPDAWVGGYRPKGDGWDQTLHRVVTPQDGAMVGINVTASALVFHTGDSYGTCKVQYRVNESDWSDACKPSSGSGEHGYVANNLPGGVHRVELRVTDGKGGVEFMGLGGEVPIVQSGSASNLTIDNTSPSFVLSPSNQWTRMTSDGLVGPWSNYTVKTMFESQGLDGFFNGSMGVTTVQDAKAELTFQGEAVYVYGSAGPNSGTAEIHLDGQYQQTINMTNAWDARNSLLYVGGGFERHDTHTLSFTNTQAGGQMVIDYALLTVPQKTSFTSYPLIIGCSVGAFVLLVVIGFLLYVLRRRRLRRARTRANAERMTPYGFAATGKGMYGSNASSLNLWRRASIMSPVTPASGMSVNPPGSGYIWGTGKPAGLNSARSQSTGTPATSTTARTTSAPGGPRNDLNPPFSSPPPDYPDFLPYRGPVQDSPPATSNEHYETASSSAYGGIARSHSNARSQTAPTPTPPAIMGSNPSASGWLHSATAPAAAAAAGTSTMSPSPSRSSSGRSGSGRSPLERINSLSTRREYNKQEYDDIALDDYYARPATAAATPSYNESQAFHNQRPYDYGQLKQPSPSVPSSTSTSASLGQIGLATRTPLTSSSSHSVARLWLTRDAVPSAYKTPTSYLPSSHGVFDGPLGSGSTGTRLVTPSHSTSTNGGYPPGSSINPMGTESMLEPGDEPGTPSSDMRRGVSLKSVKTMRSFFSGLIFAPATSINGTSVPTTPTSQAARPDSGTLPLVINSGSASAGLTRKGPGFGGDTSAQVPATATRSVFTSSPLTARTMYAGMRTPMSSSSSTPLYTAGSETGFRPLPSRSASEGTGLTMGLGMGTLGQSPNMIIELDPNSPLTESRPGSEWTVTVGR